MSFRFVHEMMRHTAQARCQAWPCGTAYLQASTLPPSMDRNTGSGCHPSAICSEPISHQLVGYVRLRGTPHCVTHVSDHYRLDHFSGRCPDHDQTGDHRCKKTGRRHKARAAGYLKLDVMFQCCNPNPDDDYRT